MRKRDRRTPKSVKITQAAIESAPKIARGMVWCKKCGRSQKVDPAECFSTGWPECCGKTMAIDSPEERSS